MLLKNLHAAVLQDDRRRVRRGVDILVRDGEILEVGEGLSGADRRDCSDRIALPGLINCHTHTPNVLTRGLVEDEPLFPWLDTQRAALEDADRGDKRAGARFSAKLALETGTTTVDDMWNTYLVDDLVGTGLRVFAGRTMADTAATDPEVRAALEGNRAFAAEYRDHPTVHPTVPVHSVYRATPDLLERAHDLAADRDLPFHVHLSETRRENEDCRAEHGTTPAGLLDRLGVLDGRSVLAHCVHLTDRDRDRIAAAGAGVAHCPASNCKLGSGVADLPALDRAGVPVGLGTDSAASNDALHLLREARTAALLGKRGDPAAVTAQRVLDAATREAAAVLGVADRLGSIEAGKRADLALLDAEDPALRPAVGDAGLVSNLVYSFGGRAETVLVEGAVVVEDGRLRADVGPAVDRVERFCAALARRYRRSGRRDEGRHDDWDGDDGDRDDTDRDEGRHDDRDHDDGDGDDGDGDDGDREDGDAGRS